MQFKTWIDFNTLHFLIFSWFYRSLKTKMLSENKCMPSLHKNVTHQENTNKNFRKKLSQFFPMDSNLLQMFQELSENWNLKWVHHIPLSILLLSWYEWRSFDFCKQILISFWYWIKLSHPRSLVLFYLTITSR